MAIHDHWIDIWDILLASHAPFANPPYPAHRAVQWSLPEITIQISSGSMTMIEGIVRKVVRCCMNGR